MLRKAVMGQSIKAIFLKYLSIFSGHGEKMVSSNGNTIQMTLCLK